MSAHATTVPILCYHAIEDEPSDWIAPLSLTPAQFADHLAAIRYGGHTPITAGELSLARRTGAPLPDRPVVLTFDDGFAGVHDAAVEQLAAMQAPASIYVTTGVVGGHSPGGDRMLTWSQICQLAEAGFEIGGHTHLHHQLDVIPAAAAAADILECKHRLEDRLSRPITAFAYPHGYHNATVRHIVRSAGFDHACAVRNSLSPGEDDPYAISRLTITNATSAARVADWLEGHHLPPQPWPRPVLVAGWRAYRRTARALGQGGPWRVPSPALTARDLPGDTANRTASR